jgi:hypothetical protein
LQRLAAAVADVNGDAKQLDRAGDAVADYEADEPIAERHEVRIGCAGAVKVVPHTGLIASLHQRVRGDTAARIRSPPAAHACRSRRALVRRAANRAGDVPHQRVLVTVLFVRDVPGEPARSRIVARDGTEEARDHEPEDDRDRAPGNE